MELEHQLIEQRHELDQLLGVCTREQLRYGRIEGDQQRLAQRLHHPVEQHQAL